MAATTFRVLLLLDDDDDDGPPPAAQYIGTIFAVWPH